MAENCKILEETFFKSVRWYDISYCCIKYEGVGRYI